MAAQMVRRRVFTNAGELIREGLVPKDIPNERNALMSYWEQQDRADAEAEAAAAAAAAEEIAAPVTPSADELLAPVLERLEAAEAAVESLVNLRMASPEAVLEGSLQIARAAGAAALVEAAGQTVIAQVDGVAAAADARLAAIEGSVSETAAAVGQLLADGRQRLDQVSAEMLAKTTSAIAKRITALEVQAAQLRGPRGPKGEWGSGQVHGKGKPPAKHPTGREWAVGEGYIDYSKETLPLYVRLDNGWDKPVATKQGDRLISAVSNTLDMAPRQTTVMPASSQSNEGSSPDTIKTRLVGVRVNERLAGLDRYDAAGFKDLADSALVSIELTALDGPHVGKTGSYLISLLQRPNGTCDETIYAEMGELSDLGIAPDIAIRSVGAYTKPASVSGSFPASATKHLICLGWTEPVHGLPGRPNQVSIKGWCKWNFNDRVVKAVPAWKLSDEL